MEEIGTVPLLRWLGLVLVEVVELFMSFSYEADIVGYIKNVFLWCNLLRF